VPCFSIVTARSGTAPSKISATGPLVSTSRSPPSPFWNTVYLSRAVAELRVQGEVLPDTLLAHIGPLGWEHISFNGDYVWPSEPFKDGFRPLRNPRSAFLDAA
jgi:hypothetical protein